MAVTTSKSAKSTKNTNSTDVVSSNETTRTSKLHTIGYELSNLWNHLSRIELCEYFNISRRTLYTYSQKLNLPKKVDKVVKATETENPLNVYISNPAKSSKSLKSYKRQTFNSWEKFAIWSKAQRHPFRIDTLEKNNKTYVTINMDTNTIVSEAEKFETKMFS